MAEISVYSPREDFTGVVGGVAFTHGHGVADEEKNATALAYFRRQGYQVGEPAQESESITDEEWSEKTAESESEPSDEADEVEVPGMPKSDATRGEVADFAEGMGVETEGLTKAQIVAAIKAEAAK